MADKAIGINPAMLRWAREQAGYLTVEPVAISMKRPATTIEAWESGAEFPTWRQLERLARDLYHRPTALFFLPDPPEEQNPSAEFRRLPASTLDDLGPDTWLSIRQARARQLDLAELASFDDSTERHIIQDLAPSARPDNVGELAMEARRYLDITIADQLEWSSEEDALNIWRDTVQSAGVWVFKRHFKQDDVAGFCLDDPRYPLVYLNNGQSKTRQIFTLFHELAHLLFGFSYLERSGIEHYVDSLEGHDRNVEIACNRFAGEFLVPTSHFQKNASSDVAAGITDDALVALARRYWVSWEVVLRKCLNQDWIDQQFYNQKVEEWRRHYSESSDSGSGGNYYYNQGTYLGVKYTALAFRGYYQGVYDIEQLAAYLDIKASNVPGLESWLNRRLAS